MAYKNVYYERKNSLIHIWDDDFGYKQVPFEEFLYIYPKNGKYVNNTDITQLDEDIIKKDLYGNTVVQMDKDLYYKYFRDHKVLENDVDPKIRYLIENYYKTNEIPKVYSVLGFDIETAKHPTKGYSEPKDAFNPIISIACTFRIYKNDSFKEEKIMWIIDPKKEVDDTYDHVYSVPTEAQLLRKFIDYYEDKSADIIIGWNSDYYDVPYTYNRLNRILRNGTGNILSPIQKCYYKEEVNEVKIAGVNHLDYMKMYKNFTYGELPSYKLDYVAYLELKENKVEYKGNLQQLYENDINKFVEYNIKDTDLMFALDDKLDFIKLCMKIAHNRHITYEDALHATRLHEGSFLSKCKEKNIASLNKPFNDEEKEKTEKSSILGAYVKPSLSGLFDWAFDLDLTSLYPSIIITLNISPETKMGRIKNYVKVWRDKEKTMFKIINKIFNPELVFPDYEREINIEVELDKERAVYKIKTVGDLFQFMKEKNLTLSGNGIFYTKDFVGILPEIMIETFEKRKHFKGLMNEAFAKGDEETGKYYNLWQMAYKIDLNSLYGVLLNKYFRLYDQENGQSITMTGRFIAQTGINEVIRIHKDMYNSLSRKAKKRIDNSVLELFSDPHLTGDTDSVILTAQAYLSYKYEGMKWKKLSDEQLVEDVSEFSKSLAKAVNERMNIFGKKWLNSNNNWLNYKEEWIAKRGYYTGVKKKYANYIIWKEGSKVDKVDVKGMDIIRSTFPQRMQKFMSSILDRLLKTDAGKEEIDSDVRNFKDELYKEGKSNYNIIATINSVKTLEKYQIFDFGEYTVGSPFSVKGALNYNLILEKFDLIKNYGKIRQGDKIKTIYVYSNPLGIEQISIPYDGNVSSKIISFIDEYIDIRSCIAGLLDNKISNMYNSLGWEEFNENFKFNDIYE